MEEKAKDTKEKTEELVKELLEEEKEEKEERRIPEKDFKRSLKSKLFIFLIILTLLFLLGGFFTLYKILNQKKGLSQPSISETKGEFKDFQVAQNKSEEGFKKKISPETFKTTHTSKYPYRLELKNFLLPLDESIFLKCDIYLYFKSYEDLKTALKKDLFLRKFFTEKLKNTKPSLWKEENQVLTLEKDLLEELKKQGENLNPEALEIEPVLLKV